MDSSLTSSKSGEKRSTSGQKKTRNIPSLHASPALAESPILFAWSLANFNGTEPKKYFTFSGDVSEWARDDNPSSTSLVEEHEKKCE
ncbi:MAG: hypothetical protein DHS20C02_12340 [Micavibrio sp.]|nr:MAG: hypothetical protein DHS20C02_12340 [Micavibrio sp.]